MKTKTLLYIFSLLLVGCNTENSENSDDHNSINRNELKNGKISIMLACNEFPNQSIQVALFEKDPFAMYNQIQLKDTDIISIKTKWNSIFSAIKGNRIYDLTDEGIKIISDQIDRKGWIVSKAVSYNNELFIWCIEIPDSDSERIEIKFTCDNRILLSYLR